MHSRMICRTFGISISIARLSVGHHRTTRRHQFRSVSTVPPDVTDTSAFSASCADASSSLLYPSSSAAATTTTTKISAGESVSEKFAPVNVSDGVSFAVFPSPEQPALMGEGTEQLYSDKSFPFRLYGVDTRASVNDSNRVISSSTSSSSVSAFLAEQLLARGAQENSNGNNHNDKIAGVEHSTNAQRYVEPNLPHDRAAAATVAATALAMSTEVKKTDYVPPAVFQQPSSQSRTNTDTGPPSLRFVSQNNAGVENEPLSGMDIKDDRIHGEEDVVDEVNKVNSETLVNKDTKGVRVLVRDEMRNTVIVDRLTSFASLEGKVPFWLVINLRRSGYTTPTLVQSMAIPLFMENRDVVGVAPTGSGKTVAFAVPALAALASLHSSRHDNDRKNSHNNNNNNASSSEEGVLVGIVEPFVLVLCPTRELVQQTRDVFSQLAGNVVRVKAAFGGQDREKQVEFLRRWGGCDVLVSTPGRLCDFVEVGVVGLEQVRFLIMDEADRMLELGFAPQLEFIMSSIKKYKRPRQTTMWTATWNATVGNLAARFLLPERVLLEVDREHKTNTDITQCLYPMQDASQRIGAIVKLYEDDVISKRQQVLVFVNRKEDVERLAFDLSKALRAPPDLVAYLHGSLRQRRREAILHGFKQGAIRILCATDVAARGLDVPALEHVVNYDLPRDTDAYVHRVGRTGRAGRSGMAHTFIVAGDPRAPCIARFIAAQTGSKLPDEVQAVVCDVERHCGVNAGVYSKYKSHARVDAGEWRGQKHEKRESRFVRGVGHIMTLKRPTPARGRGE